MPSSKPLGLLLAGGGSPIDLDASIFVQMAIFFAAFFILKGLVFGPVMKLFDAREAAMGGSRQQAQSMEKEADDKREHLESELRRVRSEASQDRERLRNEAQKLARELTDKARRENAATLASAKAQLDLEARDAHARADAEIPVIAGEIVERLLGRRVS